MKKYEISSLYLDRFEYRGYGKTLGKLIETLGRAMQNPGKIINFIDHYHWNLTKVKRISYYKLLVNTLNSIITELRLKNISVTLNNKDYGIDIISYYGKIKDKVTNITYDLNEDNVDFIIDKIEEKEDE